MSATPSVIAGMRRLDQDPYDAICDHLLVEDRSLDQELEPEGLGTHAQAHVVGTYRVLRQEVAQRTLGFYTASEYDIGPMITAKSPRYRFMELGRSCVLQPYRTKRSVELLWHGLWTYIREHRVDVMIGCASFEGTDPDAHAMALSFLHAHALAPPEWRCRAHDRLYVPMNRIAPDKIDAKAALKALPPLIKGYLRLGAFVGDGAVIDRQFGTTDVLIILPVEKIDPRYFDHFGAPDELKAASPAEASQAVSGHGLPGNPPDRAGPRELPFLPSYRAIRCARSQLGPGAWRHRNGGTQDQSSQKTETGRGREQRRAPNTAPEDAS